MDPSSRVPKYRDTVSLAGWLFADLMLGISMLFLIFNTVGSPKALPPTNTPFPTSTPTPTSTISKPTNTYTPTPQKRIRATPTLTLAATSDVGFNQIPIIIKCTVSAQGLLNDNQTTQNELLSQVKNKFEHYATEKYRAGLVITLGYHADTLNGVLIAKKANQALLITYPEVFNGAVMKPFWYSVDEINQPGQIVFEVYFFSIIK